MQRNGETTKGEVHIGSVSRPVKSCGISTGELSSLAAALRDQVFDGVTGQKGIVCLGGDHRPCVCVCVCVCVCAYA